MKHLLSWIGKAHYVSTNVHLKACVVPALLNGGLV